MTDTAFWDPVYGRSEFFVYLVFFFSERECSGADWQDLLILEILKEI